MRLQMTAAVAALLCGAGCSGGEDDCPDGMARNFEGECVPLTATDDTDTSGGGGGGGGDDTGEWEHDVCSEKAPFTSIQEAIAAAEPGDTLTLCGESFREAVLLDKAVSLTGPAEGARARIDADNDNEPAMRILDAAIGAETTLSHLTLRNGSSTNLNTGGGLGGGLLIRDASPTLEDVRVEDSTAVGSGGGVALISSAAQITDLTVTGSSAGEAGGGVYIEGGEPVIRRLRVESSEAPLGGGLYSTGSRIDIQAAVFYANGAQDNGSALLIADSASGSSVLANIAVIRQTGAATCAVDTSGGALLYNAAAFSNEGIGLCFPTPASGFNLSYGNAEGNFLRDGNLVSPGSTNLEVDPQFKNAPEGDATVRETSPCVDAGNPDDDFDDVDGSRGDIGAYGGPHATWPE